ncbi:MAG: transporter substrate-binding domain-containing protein [Undibacterium sp.]|uniref:substrate-binding periplasmic protein n=1 Tax=Undibacterium sp. TaxID=1914977 RepID=UPI002716ADE7|nr:transporter substrate-binding domain-containing protein [Undibacterium sp.]MDO8650636.1 transporter substrate-binding domain-containing protein [Undibacterium sp.]
MPKQAKIAAFLFCLSLFSASSYAQNDTIHLTRIEKNPDQFVAAQLLSDIYQRSGLQASISAVPPLRANQMVQGGQSDGEVARIEAYGEKNQNLVMVTPAYFYLTTVAYSNQPISINSIEDLRKYKVGIIRGIVRSEDLTKNMVNVEKVVDFKSLFLMLEAGRFDVALETELSGSYMIKKFSLHHIKRVGTLEKHEVFNFLTQEKTLLAPKISATINALKKSGELETLKKKYEQDFLRGNIDPS